MHLISFVQAYVKSDWGCQAFFFQCLRYHLGAGTPVGVSMLKSFKHIKQMKHKNVYIYNNGLC